MSDRQGAWEIREIVRALLCESRTGCQRDYLFHGMPPPVGAVKYHRSFLAGLPQ